MLTKRDACGKMFTEGGGHVFNRKPLMTIIKEIERIIKEKKYTVRSLEQELDRAGYDEITRGKIYRTFYTKDGRQFFLNSADETIEAVLTVLGLTSEDIMRNIVNKDNSIYTGELKEIMDWANKPEAEPYLKLAYAQYKKKLMELEVERIQKALGVNSPK